MGQNSSTHVPGRTHVRGNNSEFTTPIPKPATPPPVPKIPNYAVPENLVLPVGINEVNTRHLLRPVSQELSKFHPEYTEIFQYCNESSIRKTDDFGSEHQTKFSTASQDKENIFVREIGFTKGDNKDSMKPRSEHARTNSETFVKPNNVELSRSSSMQEKHTNGMSNGMSSPANGHVKVDPVSRSTAQDIDHRGGVNGFGLKQTSSVFDRSRPAVHKRFPSVSVSLASKDSVILEDPREHQETSVPSGTTLTSLPAKNSFDLDYSFNLTYAQLAEFRRQSRQADLENRVDKRLGDISVDREENSPQDSPVGRSYDQFSLASASSQGSDLGAGKSKKRRAPPPPGEQKDNNPGRASLTAEPPADYDLDELITTSGISTPRKFSLQSQESSSSSSSRTSKGPAPKIPSLAPPAFSPPPIPQQTSPAVSAKTKVLISTSTQASSPAKTANGDAGVRQAIHRTNTVVASTARVIADARAELEALEKLKAALQQVEDAAQQTTSTDNSQHTDAAEEGMSSATQDKYAKPEAKHHSPLNGMLAGAEDASTDAADSKGQTLEQNIPSVPVLSTEEEKRDMNGKSEEKNEKSATPRKLSSLLQHDIVMAAKTRSEKSLVKTRMSADPPRPKDQHALLREELEKASRAREERRKTRTLEDGQRAHHVSLIAKSEELKLDTKTLGSELVQGLRNETSDACLVSSVVMRDNHLPGGSTKAEQKDSERNPNQSMICSKGDSGWTSAPVVMNGVIDLSDEEGVLTSAVDDKNTVQTRTFSKDWKPEDDLDSDDDIMDDALYSRNSISLETSDGFKSSILPSRIDDMKSGKRKPELKKAEYFDEPNKRSSNRKFRKSIHETFMNAFGSISSLPGTPLKQSKSHDLGLDHSEGNCGHQKSSSSQDDSSSQVLTIGTRRLSHVDSNIPEENDGNIVQASGGTDPSVGLMKRAGVAYVGSKGQIVVLPEYESVRLDPEGHARKDEEWHVPRIFGKKKKFTYESTVRKKEKERVAEEIAGVVGRREQQMEIERVRQKDTEMQFRRLRHLESQERLHTVNIQHEQRHNASLASGAAVPLQQHHHQQQQHLYTTFREDMANRSGETSTLSPNTVEDCFVSSSSTIPQQQHYQDARTSRWEMAGELPRPQVLLPSSTAVPPLVNVTSYTMKPAELPASSLSATSSGLDSTYFNPYTTSLCFQPPEPQQQWSYIVGNFSNADVVPQSTVSGLQMSTVGPGMFVSSAADSAALGGQHAMMNWIAARGNPLSGPVQIPVAMVNPLPAVVMDMPRAVDSFGASFLDIGRPTGDTDFLVLGPEASRYFRDLDNPVYMSSDEEEELNDQDNYHGSLAAAPSKQSQRPRISGFSALRPSNDYLNTTSAMGSLVTRVQVPDYSNMAVNRADKDTEGDTVKASYESDIREATVWGEGGRDAGRQQTFPGGNQAPPTLSNTQVSSRQLPPKVYGPLGFRPVNFSLNRPRQDLFFLSSKTLADQAIMRQRAIKYFSLMSCLLSSGAVKFASRTAAALLFEHSRYLNPCLFRLAPIVLL